MSKKFKKNEITECFSTPFNRYYDHFCSVFPDLDSHFGSLGNYFERMKEASKDKFIFPTQRLTINPPFILNLMNLALELALLIFKKKKNEYIMSFILPDWDKPSQPFDGVKLVTEWATKNKTKVIFDKKVVKREDTKFKNYFVGKIIQPCDILFMKLEKK